MSAKKSLLFATAVLLMTSPAFAEDGASGSAKASGSVSVGSSPSARTSGSGNIGTSVDRGMGINFNADADRENRDRADDAEDRTHDDNDTSRLDDRDDNDVNFLSIDSDRDGAISKTEFGISGHATSSDFTDIDTNHDGALSKAEINTYNRTEARN